MILIVTKSSWGTALASKMLSLAFVTTPKYMFAYVDPPCLFSPQGHFSPPSFSTWLISSIWKPCPVLLTAVFPVCPQYGPPHFDSRTFRVSSNFFCAPTHWMLCILCPSTSRCKCISNWPQKKTLKHWRFHLNQVLGSLDEASSVVCECIFQFSALSSVCTPSLLLLLPITE